MTNDIRELGIDELDAVSGGVSIDIHAFGYTASVSEQFGCVYTIVFGPGGAKSPLEVTCGPA